MMRRALSAFPIAWIGVILWLGSEAGSAERTGALLLPILRALCPQATAVELDTMHALVRKAAHVAEYAVLAWLWIRALVIGHGLLPRKAAWWAWAIAWGVAIADESLQATMRSRTASAFDVGLDVMGALLVALPEGVGRRRTMVVCTRVALWTAAAGGTLLLIVNGMTGVESGVLWLTVPAATGALVVLRRLRP